MLALAATCARAQSLDSLPQYRPGQAVSGTIRVWGDDQMEALMKYWQEGFRKYHKDVQFETRLIGTGTGMAGLYTGVADLALMGRENTSSESMAFEWVFRYKPLGVEAATGSLDVPGKTFAVSVFINKDNPLSKLTLTQLDAVFGDEHRRGPRNIRTWGELGLTGEWKDKPINLYGYDIETNTGGFFKRAVLKGSDKWGCGLTEFADVKRPNGTLLDGGQRILDALAQDRYGIAYSNSRYANPRVKPVSLATSEGGPYYEATKENLVQRKYPLTRAVFIYVNRAPGKPVDPKVKEFLRYVLSREGQREVVQEGDFLPLNEGAVQEQLRKLD